MKGWLSFSSVKQVELPITKHAWGGAHLKRSFWVHLYCYVSL